LSHSRENESERRAKNPPSFLLATRPTQNFM
jgi:hypothetical protein